MYYYVYFCIICTKGNTKWGNSTNMYVTNASAQLRDTCITVCARNMVIPVVEFQTNTVYVHKKPRPNFEGKYRLFKVFFLKILTCVRLVFKSGTA